MRHPAIGLFALAAVAALLVAGCTDPVGGTADAPVVQKRGPAGVVPPGLAAFYGQPLAWGACASFATTAQDTYAYGAKNLQCARLTVPLDYTKPAGTTITLGLLRVPATDQSQRIGSLLVNPGGPGGSGMEAAASLGPSVAGNDLGKRFDLVGFDPRGIGASVPQVRCLTDAERDQERADALDEGSTPADVAKAEAQQKDYAAKCAQRTGDGAAMLANLGSRDVARDLDVLRSALGDKSLTYLGYSYGTRIGSTYAEEFPANVRALVLDGAVDPNQGPVDEAAGQAAGFQKAFQDWTQWCAKRQDCALGPDAAKAQDVFRGLLQPLVQRPVELSDGRKLTFDDASTGVVQALYTQQLWEQLNTGLYQLKQHDGSGLMQLADRYFDRGPDGRYSAENDAFTAVRCVDDPRVTDRRVLLKAQQEAQAKAPFLDNGQPPVAELDACAFWPVPNTGRPHLPKVSGLAPTLTISTTDDPATPYQSGVALAKALHGGLLTFVGTQHTAFLQGDDCVDQVGVRYLVDLTLPAPGTTCH